MHLSHLLHLIAFSSVFVGSVDVPPVSMSVVKTAVAVLTGTVQNGYIQPIRRLKGEPPPGRLDAEPHGSTKLFVFGRGGLIASLPLTLRNLDFVQSAIHVEPSGYTSLAVGPPQTETRSRTNSHSGGGKGFIPVIIIAGASLAFAAASAFLLYYNYVAYKPMEIVKDPCEIKTCPTGARCLVENGTAVCKCRLTCPSTSASVCGTDGQTHLNLCHLRRSACLNGTNIGVQYPGPCGGVDPCEKVKCRPGARCVVSPSQEPHCQCPTTCPDYGDHSGSRPVCGDDAVDYKDMCSINKASCEREGGVQLKYHGTCDPCAGVVCPGGEVCLVAEGRVARCSCPEQCPLQESPVCATDGRTYSNECQMRLEACRSRRTLRVMYRDSCSTGVNPCASLNCLHGSSCTVSKEGTASCECPPPCEEVMRPVCGSDGLTYDSACHLKRKMCMEKGNVKLAYAGICGADGPCTYKDCGPLAVCKQTGGLAECVCTDCGSEYEPVCGTDGISYGSSCKMRREACLKGKTIDVLYVGLCDGCETKKCDFFSTCVSDSGGEAQCVCSSNCTVTTGEEVCGTDGITYRNECELKMTACRNKLNIQTAYKGNCESCSGVVCQYKATCSGGQCVCPRDCSAAPLEQVCGSDLVTYASQCELQKRGCLIGDPSLDVLFYGSCERRSGPNRKDEPTGLTTPLTVPAEEACRDVRCDYDATCQPDADGYPRCVCIFDCGAGTHTPQICGSDLSLYSSHCHMRAEACARQTEIRVRPLELCRGMEVKPCGGDRPLTDPETGDELDCGNGHNRQDCPTEYYCHQTATFAKCCRKESGVYLKDCQDSWYGCCPDGKTPALGPAHEGCPVDCGCNKIGSYSGWCEDGRCKCRPGVGGDKCDRCQSGYWGLPKISSGHRGCLPCGCSLFGSVREDCEQMTGKCVCKPGVTGDKCDSCRNSKHILGPSGCVHVDATTPVPTSCAQVVCYFGAVCEERDSKAACVCSSTCPLTERQQVVCGSDGQTYGSECQLVLYACKYQMDIAVVSLGPCKNEEYLPVTETPAKRWTSYSLMASPLSKSTRHLLQDKYSLPGKNRDLYVVEGQVTSAADLGSILGDPCTRSDDCTGTGTVCISGTCSCSEGFIENRQKECTKEEVASFTGHSWLKLRHMKAYHKFNLELEFRTFNPDGILFYAQQHLDGTGDFIGLSLVNGYVILSYNLGSGTVRVSSAGRVALGDWHKAKVRRYQRDALLQVDSEAPVPAQSQGSLVALDLSHHPYLGYVPTNFSKVFQNCGTDLGLVGCLKLSHLESEEGHRVGACEENPCAGRPCQNSGSCRPQDGSFTCVCPQNFTGPFCEELLNPCAYSVCASDTLCKPLETGFQCSCTTEMCSLGDPVITAVSPQTPLTLPRLEGVSRAFSIEIWFKSDLNDATLLYNGQSTHPGKGDFLSLSLEGGHPVFSYSLGGHPAFIKSNETINPGQWHSVHISRTDKEGALRLDDGPITKGVSGGDHVELNLEQPLYIGKPPYLEDSPVFDGAVQRLTVNGDRIPLSSLVKTQLYGGGPCSDSACPANSTCFPVLSEFKCVCTQSCTVAADQNETSVYFDGTVVVKYPKGNSRRNESFTDDEEEEEEVYEEYEEVIEDDSDEDYSYDEQKRGARLELWVKSEQDGPLVVSRTPRIWGLLALEGRAVLHVLTKDGKHLSLASKTPLDDGRWHQILAVRRHRLISLSVDSEPPVRMKVTGGSLTSNGKFWIGGPPVGGKSQVSFDAYQSRFRGCVKALKINGKEVDLSNEAELRSCVDNSLS